MSSQGKFGKELNDGVSEIRRFLHLHNSNPNFTMDSNVAVGLANLPLGIRAQTTLLASMCHAIPLPALNPLNPKI